uniref:Uncharacterized protein n=1 Tax=Rhizophora mucronata TaxID=61149 RepID=A0A2P2NA38_RHIMU
MYIHMQNPEMTTNRKDIYPCKS